jgi:hypothetical protein
MQWIFINLPMSVTGNNLNSILGKRKISFIFDLFSSEKEVLESMLF